MTTNSLEAAIDKFGADALAAIDDYKAKLAEAADTIARLRERVAVLEGESHADIDELEEQSDTIEKLRAELSALKAAGTRADGIEAAGSLADDLRDALKNVHALITEGAITGFNPKDGDWAERLFLSQQKTHAALKRAGALSPASPKPVVGHDWIPSTLGHGDSQCRHCYITDREAAALGVMNVCDAPRSMGEKT